MIGQVDRALLQLDRYQRGDLVVIVAGSPPNTRGTTNLIHVHRIGDLGFTGSDSRPGELPSTVELRGFKRHAESGLTWGNAGVDPQSDVEGRGTTCGDAGGVDGVNVSNAAARCSLPIATVPFAALGPHLR